MTKDGVVWCGVVPHSISLIDWSLVIELNLKMTG